jgi:hypothetical protein
MRPPSISAHADRAVGEAEVAVRAHRFEVGDDVGGRIVVTGEADVERPFITGPVTACDGSTTRT